MIAIIANFEVRAGQETAFEDICRDLIDQVRANEPRNSLYTLARSKRVPNIYRMLEIYADKEAVKLHGGTDYFLKAFEALKTFLAADPVIEMHDIVD